MSEKNVASETANLPVYSVISLPSISVFISTEFPPMNTPDASYIISFAAN